MKKVVGGGGSNVGYGEGISSVGYGLGEALLGITPEEAVICCSNGFTGG